GYGRQLTGYLLQLRTSRQTHMALGSRNDIGRPGYQDSTDVCVRRPFRRRCGTGRGPREVQDKNKDGCVVVVNTKESLPIRERVYEQWEVEKILPQRENVRSANVYTTLAVVPGKYAR